MLTTADDVSPDMALDVAELLLRPESWIHRRVERVVYVDIGAVHRRISIDFDVPDGPVDAGVLYLPIALFEKRKLRNFSLIDATSRALPMLTAEENGMISEAVLAALARRYAGDDLDRIALESIARLVRASTAEGRDEPWRRIFNERLTVGRALLSEQTVVAVARDLANNFALYLPVHPRERGLRRIVKLSFDSPRDDVSTGLLARFGWRPMADTFVVPLAGYCRSYHFELEAPAETEIAGGTFYATRTRSTGENVLVSDAADDVPSTRAHFNLSRVDRLPGRVFVLLRARSTEALAGAAIVGALNAALLLFVRLRLDGFLKDKTTEAVVAVLLVLPGALLGYITRPSAHPILSSLLSLWRITATLSALTAFVGAVILYAGYSERMLETTFWVLFSFAAATALALLASWVAPRIERLKR
jgi:hypothetical protein